MNLFESIADRRIDQARRAGYFDNLPGQGKPIADLHRERKPGWWAARVVRREQDMARHEELQTMVREAMPELWRLRSETDVIARVGELNQAIDRYNRRTTFKQEQRLDPAEVRQRWRGLR